MKIALFSDIHANLPLWKLFSKMSIKENQAHYRHAVNIGSVGKPKDTDVRGAYVMLTINENSSTLNKESIGVEFIRFDYDIEKAAKAVEESPLPNEYAENLRRGY